MTQYIKEKKHLKLETWDEKLRRWKLGKYAKKKRKYVWTWRLE